MQKNKKWLWAFLLLASGTIQNGAFAQATSVATGAEAAAHALMATAVDTRLDAYVPYHPPTSTMPESVLCCRSRCAPGLASSMSAGVAGRPLDHYPANHLLEPLQMQNATFRQPLPASLKPNVSNGYRVASLPPKAFEIVGPAPAGSLSASGE